MTTLPNVPDPVLFTRLQRAMEFFQHAQSHVALTTPIDRMVAVHGLDNAVEFLLRIVIDAFEIEDRSGKNLSTVDLAGLIGETHKYLAVTYSISLPYQTELKKLRQLRNLVQHGMVDPVSELPHLNTIVHRFFISIFGSLFGLDPDNLRLSSLIKAGFVKDQLLLAESLIETEDFLAAVVACRDAFENAYYDRRQYSRLRLNLLPVLLEVPSKHMEHLYSAVVEELEHFRLGLDTRKFARYEEYIEHIPHDYRAEWKGNTSMQRPWLKHDAEFCYQFVAQTVLGWQNAELDPIYEIRTSDLPEWRESYGDLVLTEGTHFLTYFEDDKVGGTRVEVFVLDRIKKDEADAKIAVGTEYDHLTEVVSAGLVESRMFQKTIVHAKKLRLLTHNPSRWELVIRHQPVPLTWCRQDFEQGAVTRQTISINTATAEEIVDVYSDLITHEIAARIIWLRTNRGPFLGEADLATVPGIKSEQVEWLCAFTRAAEEIPFKTAMDTADLQ